MSLFPHNETPKPRALAMFILGLLLSAASMASGPLAILLSVPAFFILAPLCLPGGLLVGWFGMEFFVGDGPPA